MKFNRKQVEAAIELARLTDGPPKTRQLLRIMAEQMEAMLQLFDSSVRKARERELSAILNILDEDGAFNDAFSEGDTHEVILGKPVPREPMS